jgi:hypothetical protein
MADQILARAFDYTQAYQAGQKTLSKNEIEELEKSPAPLL